ncbi:MAG: DUF3153 domain-containing protein [Cyanobacterium sp. T60_A2020_053]|nr:DUF3153 domain-containing protein [Cyanobacterium sp. T60_A2020_053]
MKKIILLLCLLISLSGCVRYDVGINFNQAHNGAIIQHIKLGEQITSFSQAEGSAWLNGIQKQAIKLGGKSQRISKEELIVTIPFYNAEELAEKFNDFFLSELNTKVSKKNTDNLLDLDTKLNIKQNNLLFVERQILDFSADLTPLGIISSEGDIIISSGDLINLQLQFNFPWGAKFTTNDYPTLTKDDHGQYNLSLKAGQINQVQVIFWLPNYIGLGTSALLLFIFLGFFLKYPQKFRSQQGV